MSGHSKWANIKRKKEITDGAKAKVFTRMAKEIAIAVREGGPDPASNFKLYTIIGKAKANNVPNDNIDRAIKKAAGAGDKDQYEVIMYEGYGAAGVAFMVECMTDNRNRTAGDLRHFFDKFGGNLGQSGCVSFMFERKGIILIDAEGLDEAKVMDDCIECGAADFTLQEDVYEIATDPNDVDAVAEALRKKGYHLSSDEVEYIPSTYTAVDDPDQKVKLERFIETLEDNDDVSDFWHNMEDDE